LELQPIATQAKTNTSDDVLARSPGQSYQPLLDKETNPVPDNLRDKTNPYLGSENLSLDRYLSREFHELEVEHVWQRTWQAVCRETEVHASGDTHVYDITRFSIVGARTASGAPELGKWLGTIFDQDVLNMPMIQKGMHNIKSRELVVANYHEVRIRHYHQTLDTRQIYRRRTSRF
jgi:hypothetical protein